MRWAVPMASALWMAGGPAGAAGAPLEAPQRAARASAVDTPTQLAVLPASALLLIRQGSGSVAFERDANVELPIASTTKLMTAYVTLAHEPLSRLLVEQPYAAGVGESLAPVPAGASLSVPDMLRAMLLPSGNNVAYSLSVDVGGTESNFVAMMNAAAAELHLGRTHYTTPIGLDTPGGNYSTATDLAKLTRVLMRDAVFREIVDEPSASLADGVVVDNRNDLVGAYPWIVGVKTGSTADALECMVAAANLGGVRLIAVVLGAPTDPVRDADTLALLHYGLSLYRSASIAVAGHVYAEVAVKGRSRPARLVARRSLALVIARAVSLHATLKVPRRLVGPIAPGTPEGSIEVAENGRTVASVALVTADRVPPPRPAPPLGAPRAGGLAWLAGGGGLVVTLLGCSLLVVRRRGLRCVQEMQQ
jgi:D-alanyl-D-alanine carboxypeptidase (penicillin-binding protein 5/6)